MKHLHNTSCLLILLALMAGCANDTDIDEPIDRTVITCQVDAFQWTGTPQIGTRKLTQAQHNGRGGISFIWNATDTLGIYPNAGTQQAFCIGDGAGTSTAVFDGGGWNTKAGYTYTAYYPYSKYNFDRSRINLIYGTQEQKGNDNPDSLTRYDYIVSQGTAPADNRLSFQFHHLGTLVRFTLTCPKSGSFNHFSFSCGEALLPVRQILDISGDEPVLTTEQWTSHFNMNLSNISVNAGDNVVLYALLPAAQLGGQTLTVSLYGDYTCTGHIDGQNMESGKAYSYSLNMTKCEEGLCNGYEWVDLGLSVKWATANVGALSPEQSGTYYAWGETTPQDLTLSDAYKWGNYSLCNGTYSKLLKYCTTPANGFRGFTDGLVTLLPEDDAASVNMGQPWRTPTEAELDELRNNCTWTWTSRNSVAGALVTSNINGKSIFIPAVGYYSSPTLSNAGKFCDLWSSTIYADYPINAYTLHLESTLSDWKFNHGRAQGRPVRPVLP